MTPVLSPGPFSRDFEWGLATSLFLCLPTVLSLDRKNRGSNLYCISFVRKAVMTNSGMPPWRPTNNGHSISCRV